MTRLAILTCVVAAGLLAAACEPTRTGPAAVDVAALKSARLEATVFEVRLAPDRFGELDARTLAAKAAAAADLGKALAALGDAKVLYRVDQVVNLEKDSVRISKREPFVTATRMAEGGRSVNTVQYQEVGVMFNVSAAPAGGQGLDVRLAVEMSVLTDSGVDISSGVSVPSVVGVTMGHHGPVTLGRPVVMVGADASTKDKQGRSVAYVCRVVFSPPVP